MNLLNVVYQQYKIKLESCELLQETDDLLYKIYEQLSSVKVGKVK